MKWVVMTVVAVTVVMMTTAGGFGATMRDLMYQGTSANDMALFHGDKHLKKGLTCGDCHNEKIFPQKKFGAAKITMKSIAAGKHCGACHDGRRAFGITGNCNRCHPNKSADMVIYD